MDMTKTLALIVVISLLLTLNNFIASESEVYAQVSTALGVIVLIVSFALLMVNILL